MASNTINLSAYNTKILSQSLKSDASSAEHAAAFEVFRTSASGATGADGHILSFNWNDAAKYGAQIFIDTDPTYNISLRQRDSSGIWQAWRAIVTNSGTWAISITGNATTATTLATARTLTIGDTGKTFNGSANVAWTQKEIGTVKMIYNSDNTIIDNGASGSSSQAYWDSATNNMITIVYNVPGSERTMIFSKRAGYGSVLRWGYENTYLMLMRRNGSKWLADDWEKISAGYADSAGAFSSNATVSLTGDVTGTSAGSTKSWSIPTTVTKMSLNGGRISTPDTAHVAADYGKMYFLIASSNMNDSGVKPTFSTTGDTPVIHDGFIMDYHWDNSGHYNFQIAYNNAANSLSIRSNPNNTWADWIPVLTSQNVVTGDANGQIKFGGTNISVKGLGSAAFKDASGTWDINAATATKAGEASCWGYFHHNNELNFGGTNNSGTIYFGYRAMDNKPIPSNFVFGGSTGTATLTATKFTGLAAKATADGDGAQINTTYLKKSGGNMTGNLVLEWNKNITFYGANNSTSPRAVIGYYETMGGIMHCQNEAGHQASGAFYISSNGSNSANDNGGIAIDNEGVTVFGAGDPGSNFTGVFRVINEDNVGWGPIFTIKKTGATYFGKDQGYYISADGSQYSGNAASATVASKCASDALTNIAFTWSGSYATGDWMLIHNGETGSNGGQLFRAINAANTAAWVDGAHKWVRIDGDTMTGNLLGNKANNIGSTTAGEHWHQLYIGGATADSRALNSANPLIEFADTDRSQYAQIVYTDYNNQGGSDSFTFVSNQNDLRIYAPKVYGAVWNDYAEMRDVPENQKNGWKDISSHNPSPLAGRCVYEVGDDTMTLTTERLQRGCKVISDTFGFNIGETDDCKTPIAVSGRVLAYLYEDRETAKSHIGWPVCSGPDGTVSIMTEEEEEKCPSRIVGTISAVPDYEEWGTGNVKVNNRIWIYVN